MIDQARDRKSFTLRAWLWRSYVGAALIPLMLIELSFLGIYWGTSEFVFDRGAEAVTGLSTQSLSDATRREAETISARLQSVAALTGVYARETGRALASPAEVSAAEKARHSLSPEGVFYTTRDNGGSAVFYSGFHPVGPAQEDKVWRTARLDPIMKDIVASDPLITQVYLNTWDSLNRIYPYFDVLDVYAPKMDIPSYNFYYEADPQHNPEGKVVWTDAYIDPAGSGWMVSAIAPVMGETRLEAVVGIDVTVRTIVDQVLNIELGGDGYAMLVGRDGTILAMPPEAEGDLNLPPLLDHVYSEAILQDTFKPAEYNLFRRGDLGALAIAMQETSSGSLTVDLGRPVIAAWSTVAGSDWKLIAIAGEESLLAETVALRSTLSSVTQGMTVALVFFYAIFFLVLWRRSEVMSEVVARPLTDLEKQMGRIVEGEEPRAAESSPVQEIQRANDHLIDMAGRLAVAARSKSAFLAAMSHELRTPLTAIFGHAELLRMSEGKPLDRDRMAHVDGIARAGDDLLKLVEGVIDLSSLEQGEVRARINAVPVTQVVERALADIAPRAKRAGLSLHHEIAPGLPPVATDPQIAGRIVMQLLSNAVEYNRAGGQIMLRCQQAEPGWVTISVEDTGEGIAESMRDRLFVPFERLGRERGATPGAGIGLSISQRLAALMGATLGFTSEVGRGTTFTLRLPAG